MFSLLAKKWWVFGLRGIAAILFGILSIAVPEITLATLVMFFGAYVLIDGAFAIFAGIKAHKTLAHWWVIVLNGILGIVVGIITFAMPIATMLTLVFLIAAWALATGVLEIIGAIQLRKHIDNEWMLILGGVLSVIVAILLITNPGGGAISIIWVIGFYAIFFGASLLGIAYRLYRHNKTLTE